LYGEEKANMGSAAELRKQIESALADRIPAALSFRPPAAPELLPCGLAEVDAVLGGGLPLGGITELTGDHSSGRTTLVLATLAEVTRRGESCAYVDVSDALDPISASALGVDLRRLLWVRAGEASGVAAGSPFCFAAPAQASEREESREKFGPRPGWRHPRNEAVGMNVAVRELFHGKHEGRVDFMPRRSETVCHEPVVFNSVNFDPKQLSKSHSEKRPRSAYRQTSWTRLDHALRATDLLLSTGGFRAVVLDMGDVPPEQASRIPLATWFRFRLQVEKSQTLFLLMTRVACANSCAAVSLQCRQASIDWQQAADSGPLLLAGLCYCVNVKRSRLADPVRKKPVASATACGEAVWSSTSTWSR